MLDLQPTKVRGRLHKDRQSADSTQKHVADTGALDCVLSHCLNNLRNSVRICWPVNAKTPRRTATTRSILHTSINT